MLLMQEHGRHEAPRSAMLQVVGLDGSSLELPTATNGLELRKRLAIEAFPLKKGAALALYAGSERLTWAQEAFEPQTLSCVYQAADVHAAWRFLQGLAVFEEDVALEGITQIGGLEFEEQLVDLPSTMEVLSFRSSYKEGITVELPRSLQELTFGYWFNKPLGVALPDQLLTLTFGDNFNQSLSALPRGLRSLTFGQHFNQSLDHLEMPTSLESLTFGFDFNQRLPAMPQLQHLVLGTSFNQALGPLPKLRRLTWPDQVLDVTDVPAVEELVSDGWPGDGIKSLPLQTLTVTATGHACLPDSLRELTLHCADQHMHLDLPAKLRSLSFQGAFSPNWDSFTLPSLEALTCSRNCGKLPYLPPRLERLEVGGVFNESLAMAWPPLKSLTLGFDFNHPLADATLPSTLKSLTFGNRFDQPLVNLPEHLESLTLGFHFSHALQGVSWPCTLQHLTFGDLFNQPLDDIQWPKLLTLTFGNRFNQDLGHLPSTLLSLTFGKNFNRTIEALPPALEVLVLGHHFNQSLEKTELPETLHSITFGMAFDQVDGVRWPRSLRNLTLHQRVETAELPKSLRKLCSDGLTTSF